MEKFAGEAFVRGLFIYGVDIFVLLKSNVLASEMDAPAIGRRAAETTPSM